MSPAHRTATAAGTVPRQAGPPAVGDAQALVVRLEGQADRSAREVFLSTLAGFDRPDVVDGLLAYLARDVRTDGTGRRGVVAELLAALPDSTVPRLAGLLADPDPEARVLAVMVLGRVRPDRVPVEQVQAWLTGVVTGDPDAGVTAAAIGELVPVAGRAGEPALLVARDRFPADPFITYAVTQALTALDRGRA